MRQATMNRWLLMALVLCTAQPLLAKRQEIKPTVRETKELKRLFYLMSEVWGGGYFRNARISNTELIIFGVYCNSSKLKPSGEGQYTIAAKDVAEPVERYFGKRLVHRSIQYWDKSPWTYNRGYYRVVGIGDPGEESRCALKLFSLGGGFYQVDGTFFGDENNILNRNRMRVKRVTTKGRSRFIVIDYEKV
jgi:hypothetical protein